MIFTTQGYDIFISFIINNSKNCLRLYRWEPLSNVSVMKCCMLSMTRITIEIMKNYKIYIKILGFKKNKTRSLSRNQLNQKLKLMVEAPG